MVVKKIFQQLAKQERYSELLQNCHVSYVSLIYSFFHQPLCVTGFELSSSRPECCPLKDVNLSENACVHRFQRDSHVRLYSKDKRESSCTLETSKFILAYVLWAAVQPMKTYAKIVGLTRFRHSDRRR